jgi:hypothetical protein
VTAAAAARGLLSLPELKARGEAADRGVPALERGLVGRLSIPCEKLPARGKLEAREGAAEASSIAMAASAAATAASAAAAVSPPRKERSRSLVVGCLPDPDHMRLLTLF